MAIRDYMVTITGTRPLLMHADNLEWADEMENWKNDPANKKDSKAGDDRTPAFRWLGCLYHDGTRIVMPAENIQAAMMGGGALVPVPGGKSGKTFKAQSQSGMMPAEDAWPLKVRGREIEWNALADLREAKAFGLHVAKVRELGFSLFTKRAKIGMTKHVRVRPRFDEWSISGTIRVFDDQITQSVLEQILSYAGRYKGLGDWRPGSKTPGNFGMFDARVRLP
jgi:hypothetical protein